MQRSPSGPLHLEQMSVLIAANGTIDVPPATPLRDYLNSRGIRRLTAVWHPLLPQDGQAHTVMTYERGELVSERSIRLPSRPPWTFPLDLFVPVWPEPVDLWVGFNNLHAGRGLIAKRLGRAHKVVYHAVDFVPDRFGAETAMTRVFDALDRTVCRHVDGRWEGAQIALDERTARLGLGPDAGPARVVPIGAWTARSPKVPEDGFKARKVLFSGGLVERQGVAALLHALKILRDRNVEFTADITGYGEMEDALRRMSIELGLTDRVTFRGFIADHREFEEILATGSVGVSPYATDVESFTRFCDPSKPKEYAAVGLPVITTSVPPSSAEMAARGGAEVVEYTPEAIAAGIERALDNPEEWTARRRAALAYSRDYDWSSVWSTALGSLGIAQ